MNKQTYLLIKASFERLKLYCEKENYAGWDPYDGLNSKIFHATPFKRSSLARLFWIQVFKKNPINLRSLLNVRKGYNPKGIGLFLSAYCNIYQYECNELNLKKIRCLADKLLELKTTGYSGDCWGYNFDWQSRLEFMPSKTPTVVATSFAGYALFDAYDITGEIKYLNAALSSCKFVENDLNRTEKERGFIFSYSPIDHMRVYNASLLGSRLLARAFSYHNNKRWMALAKNSIIACVDNQKENGAWSFGENKVQQFVDSFHTGYKLESIAEYQKYSGDLTFENNIKKGTIYYLNNFFLKSGIPKYYDNKTYPIDIHCPAQFIVTLSRLKLFTKHVQLIEKVLLWTIKHMQDPKHGYFYYQINKTISSKIPYIRWGQAWMLYGMSFYLQEMKKYEEITSR